MSAMALSMEAVSLSFGAKRVLDNLTFSVPRGQAFGFLGPSGAGKTTTIKLLTRQLTCDGGRVTLFGRPIERATAADYERIGILSDTSALYDRMSIADNLALYGRLRGASRRRVPHLLERLGLAGDGKTLIKNCSKGMRQRAALAAALIHEPELLFLDEPTSGLDLLMQRRFVELVQAEKRRGATILLSSHLLGEVEGTCDRALFVRSGRLTSEARTADLTLDATLEHLYGAEALRRRWGDAAEGRAAGNRPATPSDSVDLGRSPASSERGGVR